MPNLQACFLSKMELQPGHIFLRVQALRAPEDHQRVHGMLCKGWRQSVAWCGQRGQGPLSCRVGPGRTSSY